MAKSSVEELDQEQQVEETSEVTKPKKRAAKRVKEVTEKPVKGKRHRRTKAEMEAARGESSTPVETCEQNSNASQLRKQAEKAIKAAERAEARELMVEAKNHVRFCETLIKEHTKGLAKAEKDLVKAQASLTKLQGPGE